MKRYFLFRGEQLLLDTSSPFLRTRLISWTIVTSRLVGTQLSGLVFIPVWCSTRVNIARVRLIGDWYFIRCYPNSFVPPTWNGKWAISNFESLGFSPGYFKIMHCCVDCRGWRWEVAMLRDVCSAVPRRYRREWRVPRRRKDVSVATTIVVLVKSDFIGTIIKLRIMWRLILFSVLADASLLLLKKLTRTRRNSSKCCFCGLPTSTPTNMRLVGRNWTLTWKDFRIIASCNWRNYAFAIAPWCRSFSFSIMNPWRSCTRADAVAQ